jgi:hypothetical protein
LQTQQKTENGKENFFSRSDALSLFLKRLQGMREFVRPFVEELRRISETDGNRVVRIHCLGAIKAMGLK